jgi:hypothetical protein
MIFCPVDSNTSAARRIESPAIREDKHVGIIYNPISQQYPRKTAHIPLVKIIPPAIRIGMQSH